jgi:hypothetical protein
LSFLPFSLGLNDFLGLMALPVAAGTWKKCGRNPINRPFFYKKCENLLFSMMGEQKFLTL